MSEDADEGQEGEAPAEAGAEKPSGGLKKKLLMFGLPAVILLLGGAGASMMFLGGGDESHEEAASGDHGGGGHDTAAADDHGGGGDGHGAVAGAGEHAAFYFYEMPELLVNINGGSGKTAFLKLKLNIEVADETLIPVLDESMPRVVDRYQGFLRELRPEDLAGSAGYYRLKLELLRRVNLAIAPARAEAVNIDQLLIQ